MQTKRLVRFILIGSPILFILLQVFWRPFDQPVDLKKSLRGLIPPLDVIFRYFDFNRETALEEWGEKSFRGHVAYWIDFDGTSGFVHSKSKRASSAIFHRVQYDIHDYPILSWRWRVGQFPARQLDRGRDEDDMVGDDYAARVYVIFLSHFFTALEAVEYLWDETLPEGTTITSPYSDRIKQLVLQSGAVSDNRWAHEKRNVLDDYERLFGRKPKRKVAAIAIMTDADDRSAEAEGFFDDIQIGKEEIK